MTPPPYPFSVTFKNLTRFYDPPAHVYNIGVTVLATWLPIAGCLSLAPIVVDLPAGTANVVPAMRFTFSDGSMEIVDNTTQSPASFTLDQFAGPDGAYVTQVEFIATSAANGQNVDLDTGVVLGYQI